MNDHVLPLVSILHAEKSFLDITQKMQEYVAVAWLSPYNSNKHFRSPVKNQKRRLTQKEMDIIFNVVVVVIDTLHITESLLSFSIVQTLNMHVSLM